ncbi:MAG: hypothetical protein KAR17_15310, partial [Cyclobacteriaceae bacterium]|nr:hypothetical protein [Cyclobacteriaceae bacterium]
MISKRKVILYFGFAGALPFLFYKAQEIYVGDITSFDFQFFSNVIFSMVIAYIITATVSAAVIYSIVLLDKYFPWDKGIWKRIIFGFFYTNFIA